MRFRPSIGLTLVLLVLGLAFGRLGVWQLDRGQQKALLFEKFENAPLMNIEQALKQTDGFARAEAYGKFDSKRHILLDNQIYRGRAGVHVFTPFHLAGGTTFLVNRGWLPLAPDRKQLPGILTPETDVLISGLVKSPSRGGFRLGEPDRLTAGQWPQLVTYFDMESIGEALGTELAPAVMQLDADNEAGFEDRQWQAAVMLPKVHRAYAVQWFALALATAIIWIALGVRRGQRLASERTDTT